MESILKKCNTNIYDNYLMDKRTSKLFEYPSYAKIMPENFTKIYTITVIMLDLSQKGSNYARIMLDHGVTMPELC